MSTLCSGLGGPSHVCQLDANTRFLCTVQQNLVLSLAHFVSVATVNPEVSGHQYITVFVSWLDRDENKRSASLDCLRPERVKPKGQRSGISGG